jgi:hypothetical protein
MTGMRTIQDKIASGTRSRLGLRASAAASGLFFARSFL